MTSRVAALAFLLLFTAMLTAGRPQTSPGPAAEPRPLDDLSAWREPTHAWAVVGDVELSAKDDKVLEPKPGAGILFNTVRTRRILSARRTSAISSCTWNS